MRVPPDDTFEDEQDQWREAVLITVAATLIRLFLALVLPVFPDEAYYWDWSRNLATGYFDHPPAIAWLIASGSAIARLLGGEGNWTPSVRFFPVVASGIAGFFVALTARHLGGGWAARRASLLFAAMPIAASGLVLATPDSPLLAATAATIYFLVRAFDSPRNSRNSLGWWALAGLCLGLAFTSKYTSILLPVSVLIAMIVRPGLRGRFLEPGPYLASAIAFVVFLPVLRWNAAHDWISFRFQLGHGLGAVGGSIIGRELELVGGQLGLVSPILFVLAAIAVWHVLRRPGTDIQFVLGFAAVAIFTFFIYSATRRRVEANWPALSYIPAMVLLAVVIPRHNDWLRRGLGLAGLMSSLIYVQALVTIIPVPARKDPIARSAGWDVLADRVQRARIGAGRNDVATYVASDRYQDVSELAYQLADHPRTFCTCITGRMNQYELWPSFPSVAKPGDNMILAIEDTSASPALATKLAPHFLTVTPLEITALRRGRDTVGVRRIFRLSGYRGGWPAREQP
jgi:4-amino-4-deoxy-L-arabinose transferase-like glycosyltransferase